MNTGDTVCTTVLGQKTNAVIKSITIKRGVIVLRLESEDGSQFSTNADGCTLVKSCNSSMIILIVSKYMDGEIRTIEGYAANEVDATKKVMELNNSVAKGDCYSYTTEFIDKI